MDVLGWCRRMVGPPLAGTPCPIILGGLDPLGPIILGYLDPFLGGWTPNRRASTQGTLHPSSLASSSNSWVLGTRLPSSNAQFDATTTLCSVQIAA